MKSNKGAAGIDKMTVDALEAYMAVHWGLESCKFVLNTVFPAFLTPCFRILT